MSTPAKTMREVLGRVAHGMAGAREAKQLQEYVEHLVWKPLQRDGEIVEVCRHCQVIRSARTHQDDCPAQEVA